MRYNRTQASRSCYAICCFILIVGWPLWLKGMTVLYAKEHGRNKPWKSAPVLSFVSEPLGNSKSCVACSGLNDAVRWPVEVKLDNMSRIDAASYVVMFSALEWNGPWWQSSTPSVLNAIKEANSTMDVCITPGMLTETPTFSPTHPLDEEAPFSAETSMLRTPDHRSLKITGDDDAVSELDRELLDCCLGKPGQTYLVACVVRDFNSYANTRGKHVRGPPFDDRCVTVTGACGGSCGAQVNEPPHCLGGAIPKWQLVSSLCQDDVDDDDEGGDSCGDPLVDDFADENDVPRRQIFTFLGVRLYWTQTNPVWHWFFMTMMFMSYVSIVVAAVPGAGVCGSANEKLPSVNGLQIKDLDNGMKCVSFSISASEHKLWVLRNMLGKTASQFIHRQTRLYDYFQDEGCRAGAYALWDSLCDLYSTQPGDKENTLGFVKYWAARLKDPSELIEGTADSFKKDSEKRKFKISEVERELNAFQGLINDTARFGIPQERLAVAQYAYMLYELIECLGDRHVWTGWDVDPTDARGFTFEMSRPSLLDHDEPLVDGLGDNLSVAEERSNAAVPLHEQAEHLPGFKDYIHDETMSSFFIKWSTSLVDVAYKLKTKPSQLDPFSDQVLEFTQVGPDAKVMFQCAKDLQLVGGDEGRPSKGRFRAAYDIYKRTKGQKRFDYVEERSINLGIYRHSYESVPIKMIYSSRAKPEGQDAVKKRDIQPGVYVCLNGDIELSNPPPGLSAWEAQRRCYGRVRDILTDRNVDGRRDKFVELVDLSEDMIREKAELESHYMSLEQQAYHQRDPIGAELQPLHASHSSAVIQLPRSILSPLIRCRGKAGGMNFAVRVLEAREELELTPKPSQTYFAIFDCRHMVTPGFWEHTILHFFRDRNGEVRPQTTVKYCQVPQNFIGVELSTDYLDMQNEYLFRYVNCQRDGVGAVTSCGTNCVWSIEKGFEFEERTMIEDTATSHKVILENLEGTYHYEKLVFGTPKENSDFLAAIFRWSRGAVQLFWLAVFDSRHGGTSVPFIWLVLLLMVLPMGLCVFGMLAATRGGVTSMYLSLGIYAAFFITASVVWWLVTLRSYGYLLRYVVLFDNCTYFFNATPAYFWCLVLPGYMCHTGLIPFDYTFFVVAIGGLLWEVIGTILIEEIKRWSIVGGQKPQDISILRSQQMYFVNAPLHGIALYSGTKSGFQIVFGAQDESSWTSFGHGGPGDYVRYWLIFLVSFECIAILSAIVQIGMDGYKDSAKMVAYGVGIVTALIFLALVFDPFCVLVGGRTRTLTLKHAYFLFWGLMLALGLIIFSTQGFIKI